MSDPGPRLRAYRRSDDPGIVHFFDRCHREDPAVTAVGEDWWRGFVELAFNRDGRDFSVVEEDGEIVALLMAHALAPEPVRHFRIVVHPGHRRSGLGSAMLRQVAEQERRAGGVLQSSCPSDWTAAHAFYQHHGFEPSYRELEMSLALGSRAAPVRPGAHPVYEAAGEQHDAQLASLHNQAYGDSRGFTPVDAGGIAAGRRLPGARYLVVEAGGVIAGFVQLVDERDGQGCIESLVVAAEQRGNGLGRVLLEHGLEQLASQGCREAVLRVESDNDAARALYDSAGFVPVAASTGFRCPVSALIRANAGPAPST